MMLDLPHLLLVVFLLAWGLEAIAVLALMAWVVRRRLRHPGKGKVLSPVDDRELEK